MDRLSQGLRSGINRWLQSSSALYSWAKKNKKKEPSRRHVLDVLSRVSLPTTVLVYTATFESTVSDGVMEQVFCGSV